MHHLSHTAPDYSVAVIGAGIVGLATAVALARQQIKVCLIAPQNTVPEAQVDQHDVRVYAISPSSQAFLQQIGVWDSIPTQRITPVTDMQIVGAADSAFAPISSQGLRNPWVGSLHLHGWIAEMQQLTWIVESREIERALQQAVRFLGIPWIDAKCTDWKMQENLWELYIDQQESVLVELIVGADGTQSAVRANAGITVEETPYDHIGIVGHFTIDRPHGNCAYQWFGEDGILALLPMPDTADGSQMSIVWSMFTAKAKKLLSLPVEEQAKVLQQGVERVSKEKFGTCTLRSSVQSFPLKKKIAASIIAPGIALVGDAAHQVHPLAGQGLNLGLGDVAALARTLQNTPQVCSVADWTVLSKYARERAEPIWAMRTVTDALYHLYHPQKFPLNALANMGMGLLNQLPPLKRFLVKKAF